MHPKETDRMAHSVDPDIGAVWSTLFAQTYLPEDLGPLGTCLDDGNPL